MQISSNYYDYYNQLYQLNSILNSNNTNSTSSTASSSSGNSSQSSTQAVDSITTATPFITDASTDITNLNYSGRMFMNPLSLQSSSDSSSSQMSQSMEKLKTDMDSIKSADIDTMSADDVKKALTTLKTDMSAVRNPYGNAASSKVDLSNMSESDMKSMLKKIQEKANSTTAQSTDSQNTELSDAFSKVNNDMESIKDADIDNMSSDDAKQILTNLKNDIGSLISQIGQSNSTSSTSDTSSTNSDSSTSSDTSSSTGSASDTSGTSSTSDSSDTSIDNMTETEMKNILKRIQEQATNTSMVNGLGTGDNSNSNNGDPMSFAGIGSSNAYNTTNSGIDIISILEQMQSSSNGSSSSPNINS